MANHYYMPMPNWWELTPSQQWSFNPANPSTQSGPALSGGSSMNPYLASAQIAMMGAKPAADAILGQNTRPQILGSTPNLPSANAYGSNFNFQMPQPYKGRNKDAMYRSLLARYLMRK